MFFFLSSGACAAVRVPRNNSKGLDRGTEQAVTFVRVSKDHPPLKIEIDAVCEMLRGEAERQRENSWW